MSAALNTSFLAGAPKYFHSAANDWVLPPAIIQLFSLKSAWYAARRGAVSRSPSTDTSITATLLARPTADRARAMSRILTVVIGQISWHEVRKLVITTYFPAKSANVNASPVESKSGRASTSAGNFSLRKEPPPGAAVAMPGAKDGTGMALWSIFMSAAALSALDEVDDAQPASRAIEVITAAVSAVLFMLEF